MKPHPYLTEPAWFSRNLDRLEQQCPKWLIGMGLLAVLVLVLTS